MIPAPPRALIVVDTESTGLDWVSARAVEVAWSRFRGYGCGQFVPPHSVVHAEPEALRINRYAERLAYATRDDRFAATEALHVTLRGNTLVGANPSFDARMLNHLFRMACLPPEPWHHRLLDVCAFGAGVLGLPPHELPGLAQLAEHLDVPVDPTTAHTAMGDVEVTAACLDRLLTILAGRRSLACASC